MNEILGKILGLIGFGPGKAPVAAAGNEPMRQSPDLLQITQLNYQYNRNNYRTMVRYAIAEAGIVLALILVAGYITLSANPQDRFFVASVDGRISRIFPLDTPTANNGEMYTRIGLGVAASLTFGFLDYDQRRQEVAALYEQEAQETLYKAFLGAPGVAQMQQNNYVYVSAVEPSRPGGVLSQGVSEDNIYRWVIQVPLLVTRKTGTSEQADNVARWTVQVLVERARSLEISRGFIITRILAMQKEGG